MQLGWDIIFSFLLGGAIFGIFAGVISYFAAYGMIISHRNRAETRLTKRLAIQAEWEANLKEKRAEFSSEDECHEREKS